MTVQETELRFKKCPGCRSLVPETATRCRMCGESLEAATEPAPEKKSRVRQRTMSVPSSEVQKIKEQLGVASPPQPEVPPATASVDPEEPPVEEVYSPPAETEAPAEDLANGRTVFGAETAESIDYGENFSLPPQDSFSPPSHESFPANEPEVPAADEHVAVEEPVAAIASSELVDDDEVKPKKKRRRRRRRRKKDASEEAATHDGDYEERAGDVDESDDEGYREDESEEEVIMNVSEEGIEPITEAGKMDQGALLGWFVHYGDDPAGIATEIRTGRFFVSREQVKESDMVIGHDTLSTPHCLVKADFETGLRVHDLMSEHNTYVRKKSQDQYYRQTGTVTLQHGDWLRFGDYEVMVSLLTFPKTSK